MYDIHVHVHVYMYIKCGIHVHKMRICMLLNTTDSILIKMNIVTITNFYPNT